MKWLPFLVLLAACKQEEPPEADPGTYDTGPWQTTETHDYGACHAYAPFVSGRVAEFSTQFLDGPSFNGLSGYDFAWTIDSATEEGLVSRTLVSLTDDWEALREEEGFCDDEGYKVVSYHEVNSFRELWVTYDPPLLAVPADMSLGGKWVVDTVLTSEDDEGDVDTRDQEWTIEVVAEDQVSFDIGTFLAPRLQFQRTEDENRMIRSEWYAPDLGVLGHVSYDFSGAPSSRTDLQGVTAP